MSDSDDFEVEDVLREFENLIERVHGQRVGNLAGWLTAQNRLQVLRCEWPGLFARVYRSMKRSGQIQGGKRQGLEWRKPY